MLETEDVDFDSKSLCAYHNDISTLIIYYVTKILAQVIHVITFRIIDEKVTLFKFWLTLFLFFDLPVIVTTIIQGTYLEWYEEPLLVAIYLLAPIAFAIIFRFYNTIFRTFYKLYIMKVFCGEPEKIHYFMTQLNNRLNSRKALAAYLVIGIVAYFLVSWFDVLLGIVPLVGFYRIPFPLGMIIYHKIWMLVLWLASLSFLFKINILLRTIRAIPIKRWNETAEPHFIINLYHPDGGAGFNDLSFLWIRVTTVGIIFGIGIIFYAIRLEWSLSPWILSILYLSLAPLLVSAPFVYLHSLMSSFKEKEMSKFYKTWDPLKQWDKNTEKEGDKLQNQYNELKKLPTWPFSLNVGKLYWGLALFPVIPTIMGIIDSFK